MPHLGAGVALAPLQRNVNVMFPTRFPLTISGKQSASEYRTIIEIIGDPGRIRTCDLQLRRLLLYPLSYGAVGGADFI